MHRAYNRWLIIVYQYEVFLLGADIKEQLNNKG